MSSTTTDAQIKVLHVIAISGVGGAEKILIDLVQEQRRQGAAVSCIFFYKAAFAETTKRIAEELKHSLIQIQVREYCRILDKQNYNFILSQIEVIKPAIVHSHLKQADIWLSILKWKKRIDIPVVSTLHGYRDSYQNQYGLVWNKKAVLSPYYLLTKLICNQLDFFVAVSKGIANFYKEAGLLQNDKMKVIYHGIKISNELEIAATKDFNYKLVILGRLVLLKGHQFAFEAVSKLKEKYPQISLHIIGTGPEEDVLKEKVKSLELEQHVFFHGFKNNIDEELKKYDLMLVPSAGESFGMIFLDAFQAGLPVVAFDVPAGNEIITHGSNGLLAKAFDVDSLSDNIELLFNDKHLRTEIVKNAKEVLLNKFNITRMGSEYLATYKEVIKLKKQLL